VRQGGQQVQALPVCLGRIEARIGTGLRFDPNVANGVDVRGNPTLIVYSLRMVKPGARAATLAAP
jgi:hypothetical protein